MVVISKVGANSNIRKMKKRGKGGYYGENTRGKHKVGKKRKRHNTECNDIYSEKYYFQPKRSKKNYDISSTGSTDSTDSELDNEFTSSKSPETILKEFLIDTLRKYPNEKFCSISLRELAKNDENLGFSKKVFSRISKKISKFLSTMCTGKNTIGLRRIHVKEKNCDCNKPMFHYFMNKRKKKKKKEKLIPKIENINEVLDKSEDEEFHENRIEKTEIFEEKNQIDLSEIKKTLLKFVEFNQNLKNDKVVLENLGKKEVLAIEEVERLRKEREILEKRTKENEKFLNEYNDLVLMIKNREKENNVKDQRKEEIPEDLVLF